MNVGDSVRVVNGSGKTHVIKREEDGMYLVTHRTRMLMSQGMMDIHTWYEPHELEVVE